jgi:D-alanyl-lipoteichoic acid acyltransferase DltB (MBOAT superfamily)
MLFNSYEFIFAFLPVTLVCFYGIGTVSQTWALRWIIFASVLFYAWWRPLNVLLIAPSIVINFALAQTVQRFRTNQKQFRASRSVLLLGLAFNIVFLGYFKYSDFGRTVMNDIFGTNFVLTQLILPLGISFITFQKIAFLIDVHAGRVKSFTLQDYCLFVLFFPQLIAGPIVHYREMMPQFHAASCRFNKQSFAVGLTLLSFGLFKKVVLADHIATFVSPIYDKAASGSEISLIMAWAAAVGFTLQIYFDFSGYTDMALGIARFFGIKLPQNFNSPLQASNIIDFWLRWHMTLTRFLTAYIYNPLTLWLTRRRVAIGRPLLGGHDATIDAFIYLLMFPLLLTMLVSGLWHGAGYGFVIWGLLHGVYLTINHAWRLVGPPLWPNRLSYDRIMKPVGFVLTFVSVCAAMVFFRSPTVASAADLIRGLVGLNGLALPNWLHGGGVAVQPGGHEDFIKMAIWILVSMFIALACPNTLQILDRFEPALGVKPLHSPLSRGRVIEWNPSLAWAMIVAIIAVAGTLSLSAPTEFLYWQF